MGLLQCYIKFLIKKTSSGATKNENIAQELHTQIIRKFVKIKVNSPFIDNIWVADLADMQLISKFNKGSMNLIFWVNTHRIFFWKIKNGITITNGFQKFLKESSHKANKIWVDKGSEFYNRSMKSFLQNNNIEMYSAQNKGKSVGAKRVIRTLKNKIYKFMTSI